MQLEAENIHFRYHDKSPWILKGVSLTVKSGERAGIVGPSGYGKSTLARILSGYRKASSGSVLLDGKALPEDEYCPVQMICQHPELAVNPRWKMEKILKEAWNPDDALLDRMGIERSWLTRWPAELSGGELQRFCIARVLSLQTRFLICDEITTMLDVITQAQIWNVVLREAAKRNMGILAVTHNRNLAERISERLLLLS